MHSVLVNRSIIEVSGDDVIQFLQKLTTNDITKADYCYTYMLNNQGRYLFDVFIFIESTNRVLVDVDGRNVDALVAHLNLYKLRAKVEIKNSSDIYQIVYSHHELEYAVLASRKDPRYLELGMRSIVKNLIPHADDLPTMYRKDKYDFAIVDGYEDLVYGKSIPVEYGANELRAVSYDKGCYIGQEVISRAKYQGVIRKVIFHVSSKDDISCLSKGDIILAGDNKIGTICSACENQAIALIREEQYLANQNLGISVNNIEILITKPPWR